MTDLPYTFGDYLEAYGPDPAADALNEIAAGLRHDRSQRRDEALLAHLDGLEAELTGRRSAEATQMLEREFDRLGVPEQDRPAVARRAWKDAQDGQAIDLESAVWLHLHDEEERAAEWFGGELDQHEQRIGRTITDAERRRIFDQIAGGQALDVAGAHAATNEHDLENPQGRWRYASERVEDLRSAEQREEHTSAAIEHELGARPARDLTAPGEAGIEARAQAVRDLIDNPTTDQE